MTGRGGWKLICRGLKFFQVNSLGSETVNKHLVGVSNSRSSKSSLYTICYLLFMFFVVLLSPSFQLIFC